MEPEASERTGPAGRQPGSSRSRPRSSPSLLHDSPVPSMERRGQCDTPSHRRPTTLARPRERPRASRGLPPTPPAAPPHARHAGARRARPVASLWPGGGSSARHGPAPASPTFRPRAPRPRATRLEGSGSRGPSAGRRAGGRRGAARAPSCISFQTGSHQRLRRPLGAAPTSRPRAPRTPAAAPLPHRCPGLRPGGRTCALHAAASLRGAPDCPRKVRTEGGTRTGKG